MQLITDMKKLNSFVQQAEIVQVIEQDIENVREVLDPQLIGFTHLTKYDCVVSCKRDSEEVSDSAQIVFK